MILLSKKQQNNTYFDFKKILKSGYTVKEDKDRITQKFVNGNRKQIVTEYEDVIITITLDTFDIDTTKTYLDQLTEGTYKYYSIKDKTYKEADFIIEEKPTLDISTATSNGILVDSYEITLLRAGD